jgi:hypothetical protein
MTNWVFALGIWAACLYAAGCEGKIESGRPHVIDSDEDAGPYPCTLIEPECAWSDPATKTGWDCRWVELCSGNRETYTP